MLVCSNSSTFVIFKQNLRFKSYKWKKLARNKFISLWFNLIWSKLIRVQCFQITVGSNNKDANNPFQFKDLCNLASLFWKLIINPFKFSILYNITHLLTFSSKTITLIDHESWKEASFDLSSEMANNCFCLFFFLLNILATKKPFKMID